MTKIMNKGKVDVKKIGKNKTLITPAEEEIDDGLTVANSGHRSTYSDYSLGKEYDPIGEPDLMSEDPEKLEDYFGKVESEEENAYDDMKYKKDTLDKLEPYTLGEHPKQGFDYQKGEEEVSVSGPPADSTIPANALYVDDEENEDVPINEAIENILNEADFKEDEHPREDSGKFTSGGGTGKKADIPKTKPKEDFGGYDDVTKIPDDKLTKYASWNPEREDLKKELADRHDRKEFDDPTLDLSKVSDDKIGRYGQSYPEDEDVKKELDRRDQHKETIEVGKSSKELASMFTDKPKANWGNLEALRYASVLEWRSERISLDDFSQRDKTTLFNRLDKLLKYQGHIDTFKEIVGIDGEMGNGYALKNRLWEKLSDQDKIKLLDFSTSLSGKSIESYATERDFYTSNKQIDDQAWEIMAQEEFGKSVAELNDAQYDWIDQIMHDYGNDLDRSKKPSSEAYAKEDIESENLDDAEMWIGAYDTMGMSVEDINNKLKGMAIPNDTIKKAWDNYKLNPTKNRNFESRANEGGVGSGRKPEGGGSAWLSVTPKNLNDTHGYGVWGDADSSTLKQWMEDQKDNPEQADNYQEVKKELERRGGEAKLKAGYIQCPHCDQQFSNIQWLSDHINEIHEGKEVKANEAQYEVTIQGMDGGYFKTTVDAPDEDYAVYQARNQALTEKGEGYYDDTISFVKGVIRIGEAKASESVTSWWGGSSQSSLEFRSKVLARAGYTSAGLIDKEFWELPDGVQDKIFELYSGGYIGEAVPDCEECGGDGFIDVPDRNSEDGLRQVPCEKCDDYDQFDTYDESRANEDWYDISNTDYKPEVLRWGIVNVDTGQDWGFQTNNKAEAQRAIDDWNSSDRGFKVKIVDNHGYESHAKEFQPERQGKRVKLLTGDYAGKTGTIATVEIIGDGFTVRVDGVHNEYEMGVNASPSEVEFLGGEAEPAGYYGFGSATGRMPPPEDWKQGGDMYKPSSSMFSDFRNAGLTWNELPTDVQDAWKSERDYMVNEELEGEATPESDIEELSKLNQLYKNEEEEQAQGEDETEDLELVSDLMDMELEEIGTEEFREDEHPRDHGKFTTKGGGDTERNKVLDDPSSSKQEREDAEKGLGKKDDIPTAEPKKEPKKEEPKYSHTKPNNPKRFNLIKSRVLKALGTPKDDWGKRYTDRVEKLEGFPTSGYQLEDLSVKYKAPILKAHLMDQHPDTKWSVKSEHFSGGSAIDAGYKGGEYPYGASEIGDVYSQRGAGYDSQTDYFPIDNYTHVYDQRENQPRGDPQTIAKDRPDRLWSWVNLKFDEENEYDMGRQWSRHIAEDIIKGKGDTGGGYQGVSDEMMAKVKQVYNDFIEQERKEKAGESYATEIEHEKCPHCKFETSWKEGDLWQTNDAKKEMYYHLKAKHGESYAREDVSFGDDPNVKEFAEIQVGIKGIFGFERSTWSNYDGLDQSEMESIVERTANQYGATSIRNIGGGGSGKGSYGIYRVKIPRENENSFISAIESNNTYKDSHMSASLVEYTTESKKKIVEFEDSDRPVSPNTLQRYSEPIDLPNGKNALDQTYGVSEPETPDGQDLTGITVGEEETTPEEWDKSNSKVPDDIAGEDIIEKKPPKIKYHYFKEYPFGRRAGKQNPFGEANEVSLRVMNRAHQWWDNKYPERQWKDMGIGERQNVILAFLRDPDTRILESYAKEYSNLNSWSEDKLKNQLEEDRDALSSTGEWRINEGIDEIKDELKSRGYVFRSGGGYAKEGGQGSGRKPYASQDPKRKDKAHVGWKNYGITDYLEKAEKEYEEKGEEGRWDYVEGDDGEQEYGDDLERARTKMEAEKELLDTSNPTYPIKGGMDYQEGGERVIDEPRENMSPSELEDWQQRRYKEYEQDKKAEDYLDKIKYSMDKGGAKFQRGGEQFEDPTPWASLAHLGATTVKDILFPEKEESEEQSFSDMTDKELEELGDKESTPIHAEEGGKGSGKKDHKQWMRAIEEEHTYDFCENCNMITEQVNQKCDMCGKKVE